MQIAGTPIGPEYPPFCIAELSANHLGQIQRMFDLIRLAKESGADAVKFQCYTPDSITLDCDLPHFVLQEGPWKGRKLYDLYKEAHTPRDWFKDLFSCAKDHGITAFASVFDRDSVDFLEGLGVPAYKISSFDITDIALIEHVAATGKPVILSTGMASRQEVIDADDILGPSHDHLFLHCVSGYPTPVVESNLSNIRSLSHMVAMPVGISDHSLGNEVVCAAVALGAVAVEKHFTFLRSEGGPDSEFSLEPSEFAAMSAAARQIHQALKSHQPSSSERASSVLRKGLYAVTDIALGERFSEANVRAIRPCGPLPPSELSKIVGKFARSAISRGSPIQVSSFSE